MKNKVVFITGGTGGFGLATAKKFSAAGATVIIASVVPEEEMKAAKDAGYCADYVKLDVTSSEQWVAARDYVIGKYGKIDVLANIAGTGVAIKTIEEQSFREIDLALDINLKGTVYGTKVFAPDMIKQKDGIIINFASVCARHCWDGWSVYAAAKAGVLNFTKGTYVDLQPHGVRATCIIPGSCSTGFQKNANIGEVVQSMTPDDIANAVFFAASMPKGAVVEEMTVWATSQVVNPL